MRWILGWFGRVLVLLRVLRGRLVRLRLLLWLVLLLLLLLLILILLLLILLLVFGRRRLIEKFDAFLNHG